MQTRDNLTAAPTDAERRILRKIRAAADLARSRAADLAKQQAAELEEAERARIEREAARAAALARAEAILRHRASQRAALADVEPEGEAVPFSVRERARRSHFDRALTARRSDRLATLSRTPDRAPRTNPTRRPVRTGSSGTRAGPRRPEDPHHRDLDPVAGRWSR